MIFRFWFICFMAMANWVVFAFRPLRNIARHYLGKNERVKKISRSVSGLFTSKPIDPLFSSESEIMDFIGDNLKWIFNIKDVSPELEVEIEQLRQMKMGENKDIPRPPSLTTLNAISQVSSPRRQIVVGYLDIDPLSNAEKYNDGRSLGARKRTTSANNHWLN